MAQGYRRKPQQAEIIARWRASRLTRGAFCAQLGISPGTFARWLAREPAAMTFAEVLTPVSPPPARSCAVVVILPGGARLVVEPGSPMSLVAELARVLG
jgi:hypothetical protein